MSESFIEPDSLNATLLALGAVVDENGSTRFINKELASYNFDGMIPTSSDTIFVNELEVGMSFLPIGETEGSLKTIIKIDFDDPEMTGSPTNDYIISYLGSNGEIETTVYDGNENIEVYFEDWNDKVLGDNGWIITQEGNAIFSNVAVRGRIEATEGLIDGDLIVTGSLSTSETADTTGGIVFDSDGIFAYDTDGNNTFLLDAATGDISIFGTPGDDLLTGEDVSDGGTTIISANRITTGSVTGRVFRSNSTMTPTSGTGIYLDGNNNVRFSDPDATFTFNSSGLNITNGSNATLTFNSTGLSITGAGVTIGGENPDNFITGTDVGPSGTTTISGDRITTGSIESSAPDFIWNGISTFSTQGTRFSVNDGQIISEQFRIDSAGNAEFSGTLVAADGTFSGTLSANSITSGTLSADYISGGTLDFDDIIVTNLSAGDITTGTFSGDRISAGIIDSVGYSGVTDGSSFATNGTAINLNNGSITSEQFRIDSSGNAAFAGSLSSGISISSPTITGGSFRTTAGSSYIEIRNESGTFVDSIRWIVGGAQQSRLSAAAGVLAIQSAISCQGGGDFGGAIRTFGGNVEGFRIITSVAGSQIAPSSFNNAQTPLQIRTSDSTIGIQSSVLDIKTNIIPLIGDQIHFVPEEKNGGTTDNLSFNPDSIFNITPVEYTVIDDESEQRQVGFIVEDLIENWPQAVTYTGDDPISYNTNSIVAGLVYAIKKQKYIIEDLEKRIIKLEGARNG